MRTASWIIFSIALGIAIANPLADLKPEIDSESEVNIGHRVKKSPEVYIQGRPYQPGQLLYTDAQGYQLPQAHYMRAGPTQGFQVGYQSPSQLEMAHPAVYQSDFGQRVPSTYSQQPQIHGSSVSVQTPLGSHYVQLQEPAVQHSMPSASPMIQVQRNGQTYQVEQLEQDPIHYQSPLGYSHVQNAGVLGNGPVSTQVETNYPLSGQNKNVQLQYDPNSGHGSLTVSRNGGQLGNQRTVLNYQRRLNRRSMQEMEDANKSDEYVDAPDYYY